MNSTRSAVIPAGTVVGGRYEIQSLLGRGGMASVYRAADVPLGRSVALKVFTVDTEGSAGLGRESSEVRLLASLNHHALVTLFDANIDDGSGDEPSYLVMELVDGPTLRERIDAGPIAPLDVAQLVVDLAEALHVVHGKAVVHRDVKPANILLHPSVSPAIEFRAKLSDFGIAYLIDSTRLTTPGTIIGTASYLSPEQARGAAPGPPSDIYSLGLVALEALTGVRAFDGSMIESLSARLVGGPAIPAAVGAQWAALLARMTELDPGARPSALDIAEHARRIERDLYASTGETAPAAALPDRTELLGATVPLDASMPLGATVPLGATEPLGAATRLLPPTRTDDQTELLPAAEESAAELPAASKRRRPARIAAGCAVVVAALVAAVLAWNAATGGTAGPPPPSPLPSNAGELGVHLDELLETVTP